MNFVQKVLVLACSIAALVLAHAQKNLTLAGNITHKRFLKKLAHSLKKIFVNRADNHLKESLENIISG
jgi:hypothetical protein